MQRGALETELKLSLPARFIRRAVQHPAVERAATEPPRTARLLSVYYDTPKRDLHAAGIALRLRRTPTGWIQGVKWGGAALGGLHHRGESETRVPGQQLRLEVLDHPELAAVFAFARVYRQLKPVFSTEFERISRVVRIGSSAVELSADHGQIVAGTAGESISELELELISGEAAALFDLAEALQAQLPLHPMSQSKAERGYALAGHVQPPSKAAAIVLDAQMSIGQSATAVLTAGLSQLQANEHGMLSDRDAEYLHQMRVAVRRLRSALSVYADALAGEAMGTLRGELRWAGARLGCARDWDVFATELLPPLRSVRGADPTLNALAKAAEQARARANQAARTAVRSRRYARLILSAGHILTTGDWGERALGDTDPVLPFATQLLEQRHVKVLKRGAKLRTRSLADLHALRIAIKNLRYASEFFEALFPNARARSFRDRLSALQECLGALNDQASMQRLAQAAMPRSSRLLEALLDGWSARVVFDERARLHALWRQFRHARKFW